MRGMDPFRHPRPYCKHAWQPPPLAPTWRRDPVRGVDVDGLLILLGRAQLPAAELAHMGAPAELLHGRLGPYVQAAVAAPLLGRILLDAEEIIWAPYRLPVARTAGLAIIRQYFA